jgi:hypothetical protein
MKIAMPNAFLVLSFTTNMAAIITIDFGAVGTS